MKRYLSLGTDSRKCAVFMVVWASCTALLWFGRVTPDNWIDLTKWGYGFLAAGLTAEHFEKSQAGT